MDADIFLNETRLELMHENVEFFLKLGKRATFWKVTLLNSFGERTRHLD